MKLGQEPGHIFWTEDPSKAANLTKREIFAAMAMQAFAPTDKDGRMAVEELADEKGQNILEFMARMAVNQADALIAELAK